MVASQYGATQSALLAEANSTFAVSAIALLAQAMRGHGLLSDHQSDNLQKLVDSWAETVRATGLEHAERQADAVLRVFRS